MLNMASYPLDKVFAVGRSQVGNAASDRADQMFHLAIGSEVFLGAWFAQVLYERQPDNIGAFEMQALGGIRYFPIEIFGEPDGQLRSHCVLQARQISTIPL